MDLRSEVEARLLVVLVVTTLAIASVAAVGCGGPNDAAGPSPGDTGASTGRARDAALAKAFDDRATDLEVEGAGTVVRLLADDREGSRHQRFILRVASGQTLLVAHNIDVAPRLEGLKAGDAVSFRGVYEWNAEGGTVHWTHHDPDGQHALGWLRYDGTTYR